MQTKTISGFYTEAKIFTVDDESIAIDQHAEAQIKMICDNIVSSDSMIRVMPDVHAGKVGPIGLTMQFSNERIIPNLIGDDIGCGIEFWEIFPKHKLTKSDFVSVDKAILCNVPIRHQKGQNLPESVKNRLSCLNTDIDISRVSDAFGTLGGGNHFIEIDTFDDRYLLTIHSGSRNLGGFINDYYNTKGQEVLKNRGEDVPYEMTYIEDELFLSYLDDVRIANYFAKVSRAKIADKICSAMKWNYKYFGGSVHNTVGDNENDLSEYPYSLHKGSCSTVQDWPIIIPMNMKDGIIIAHGKYNYDWNNSCPHGSGRLYKRSDINNITTLSDFKKEMEGIYSSSINNGTLDESPIAYRRIDSIIDCISDTVDVVATAKPVFSFKGGKK